MKTSSEIHAMSLLLPRKSTCSSERIISFSRSDMDTVKQQQITIHGQSVRLLASPLWYCPVKFPSCPSNSVHCYALCNIFRVNHVRLLRFSSFSSYFTENSLSQSLLLDRPLFLWPQPLSHTEGSLSTLQRQMTSLYVGIHIKKHRI